MLAGVTRPLDHAGDDTSGCVLAPQTDTIEHTLEEIDEDDRHPSVHDVSRPESQDQWATADPVEELVAQELVAEESSHDADRGLFVAPV
jgi:hypothetical protein